MSLHSYSRIWLHIIWATLERRPLLKKTQAAKVSGFLSHYAVQKGIYMKINYVNPDHVHILIDLPTNLCVEEVMHLFKGSSSHWINENKIVAGGFAWGRGYGVFSVSQSVISRAARYIATQEEHHKKRDFAEELKLLVERNGLKWVEKETVKTVSSSSKPNTPLKRGVNEMTSCLTPPKRSVNTACQGSPSPEPSHCAN